MLGHLVKFVRDKLSFISKDKKKKPEKAAKENEKSPARPVRPGQDVQRQRRPKQSIGSEGEPRPPRKTYPPRPSKPNVQQQPQSDKSPSAPKPAESKPTGPRPSGPKPSGPRPPRPPRTQAPKPSAAAVEIPKEDNWDISQFKVEPAEGKTRFHDLNLPKEIMHAIADLNFRYCTPIQSEILFNTLAEKDATGQAQTGTGKTAAFLITIFTHILRKKLEVKPLPGKPRALVLAPTRELVMQIASDAQLLSKYTSLKVLAVFGGMDYQKQKKILNSQAIDLLVATPGRLIDFHNRRDVHLSGVEILVIDEADRMLDMGFIPDVKRIVYKTPPKSERQTLFFSATMTTDVNRLAAQWTKDAVRVEIEPESVAVSTVEQIVYIVTNDEKFPLLLNLILKKNLDKVMIFANRRDETRTLSERLGRRGISCAVLSGDVDQKQRIRILDEFKSGKNRVLVATDVAGRGIHIEGVSHVINYTLPEDPEDYVHRIGRTGRAGASGISISFASEDDSFQIPAIEEFIGNKLTCTHPDEDMLKIEKLPIKKAEPKGK